MTNKVKYVEYKKWLQDICSQVKGHWGYRKTSTGLLMNEVNAKSWNGLFTKILVQKSTWRPHAMYFFCEEVSVIIH